MSLFLFFYNSKPENVGKCKDMCVCVCVRIHTRVCVYVGGGACVSFLPQLGVLGFILTRQTLMALNSPAG